MPKDNVENAIRKATAKDEADLQEINYEGYGPYGVAIWIETTTDNPTRTVANIRSYFNRCNGALGTSGSLEFIFDRKGVFTIPAANINRDNLELMLIENGADEIQVVDDDLVAYTSFEDFIPMQRALETGGVDVASAEIRRIPNNTVTVSDDQAEDVIKLIERIEDDDDVQNVFHNMTDSQ
jgi:YebC/PmpR family DNA-binding regulatory protein